MIDYKHCYERADDAYSDGNLDEAEFWGRLWLVLLAIRDDDEGVEEQLQHAQTCSQDEVFEGMYG